MTTTQLAQAIAAMPRYTDAECMAILAAAEADMERAWDEANRAKTQARMAAKREELRKKLGCEYRDVTFDDFDREDQASAKQEAIEYVDSLLTESLGKRKGLLLAGNPGTGKTRLTAAVTNKLIDSGVEVLFGTVEDHVGMITSEFGTDHNGEYLERMKTADVLVIDDLYKAADWSLNKIFEVINARSSNGLPLIITTNLDVSELKKYVGARIYSRIAGMCHVVVMTGEDWRLRA